MESKDTTDSSIDGFYSEFRTKELEFSAIVTGFIDETGNTPGIISEERVNRFAKAMSGYTQHLNRCLKVYSKINYQTNQTKKVKGKAYIKYSYDFLALLTAILRKIEAVPTVSDALKADIRVIDSLIDHKAILIKTDYYNAALQRLTAFYDPAVRKQLEDDLSKRIDPHIL